MKAECWKNRSVQQNEETDIPYCNYCKKYGHVHDQCWHKNRQANYVEEQEQEANLCMVYQEDTKSTNDIWFLDSGCSNHMTLSKTLFKELDESYKIKVRLGDDKQMQVEGKGKGTVAVKDVHGNVKLLCNVYFIPDLTQNLLSVG